MGGMRRERACLRPVGAGIGSILLVVELLAEVHQPDGHGWFDIPQAPVGAEVLVTLML